MKNIHQYISSDHELFTMHNYVMYNNLKNPGIEKVKAEGEHFIETWQEILDTFEAYKDVDLTKILPTLPDMDDDDEDTEEDVDDETSIISPLKTKFHELAIKRACYLIEREELKTMVNALYRMCHRKEHAEIEICRGCSLDLLRLLEEWNKCHPDEPKLVHNLGW